MGRFDSFFDDTPAGGDQVSDNPPALAPIDSPKTETATETPITATDTSTTEPVAQEIEPKAPENESSTAEIEAPTQAADVVQNEDEQQGEVSQSDSSPLVPPSITDKPQTASLKPRYQGDSEFNQMVAEDWFEVIKADPRSYQALLYRPSNGTYGVVDEETGLESAPFTDMDNNQRDLTYDDPVIVVLRDSNDSREAFEALDDDSNQDGLVDDYLIVSIADKAIPKGSILEWNEEVIDGSSRRVWWYVNQIFTYGTQHVGTLYYCIPARTFDTTYSGLPQ